MVRCKRPAIVRARQTTKVQDAPPAGDAVPVEVRIVNLIGPHDPTFLSALQCQRIARAALTAWTAHHAVAFEQEARVEWFAEILWTIRDLRHNVLARRCPRSSRVARKECVPKRAGYSGEVQEVERLKVRCDLA